MGKDKRVDAAVAAAAPFAQPILAHLRALVHATIPEIEETIKWGMPHFMVQGKNLAGMASFKAHCAFVIHGDGRQGDAMGQYGKIATMAGLPADEDLQARLLAAKARIECKGTALKKKPAAGTAAKPELAITPAFAAALAESPPAKAALEGFAPSHRREYVEWINDAKRPETRDKRIAQAIQQLAEGKKRNWKYENC